jgi:hypothetical protein
MSVVATRVKERVLREYGDSGADTLARYWAQVEYAAFWCARMLDPAEGIEAVTPEGVEDVVITRAAAGAAARHHELHQVKTRDESRGPWTTADALPVLCAQYRRRHAFDAPCTYVFVSDARADTERSMAGTSLGPLCTLKRLLDLRRDGQGLLPDEATDWAWFEARLPTKVREHLSMHGEDVPEADVLALLEATVVDTNNAILRNPNNLVALDEGLSAAGAAGAARSLRSLRDTYDRLTLLIVRRVIETQSVAARTVVAADVLACCGPWVADDVVDLAALPGTTTLEKKALLGGFATTDLSVFRRQRMLWRERSRAVAALGDTAEDLVGELSLALLELQHEARRAVPSGVACPGAEILRRVRDGIGPVRAACAAIMPGLTDAACVGALWEETEQCQAWWHAHPSAAAA